MAYMIVSLHPSRENTSVPKRSTDLISIVSRKMLCLAIFMIRDIFPRIYRVCPHTRFLNTKSPAVTFKKSRKLILPFFLEEETHLMHMKCCASASFLNLWFNNNQQINCQLCNCKCCNLSRICRCRSRLINHNKAILWMLLSFVMVIIFAAGCHSDCGIMNDNE